MLADTAATEGDLVGEPAGRGILGDGGDRVLAFLDGFLLPLLRSVGTGETDPVAQRVAHGNPSFKGVRQLPDPEAARYVCGKQAAAIGRERNPRRGPLTAFRAARDGHGATIACVAACRAGRSRDVTPAPPSSSRLKAIAKAPVESEAAEAVPERFRRATRYAGRDHGPRASAIRMTRG